MKKKLLITIIIFICFFIVGCNKNNNNDDQKQNSNVEKEENSGSEEKKEKITIYFDSDGGTSVEPITFSVGEKVSPPQNPTKEGYKFLGWYYEDELFDFSTMPKENITLVAKWQKIKTYEVSFNSNGGSEIEKQVVNESEKVTEPVNPVRTGYKFLYWEFNGKKYDFNTPVTQNITLVAKWEKSTTQEKVTYEKYKNAEAVDMVCYTEESIKANNYVRATNVKKGDRIVCMVGFETYSTDKVKKLQYTLSYGSGLKLVNANTPSATKNGNTYTFTLNNPTSVGETGLGEFTFEVIGTTGLTYGIKDIKFTTTDNKNYYTNNNVNTLSPYTKYKNAEAVDMVCYTEESIKANNYVRATNVKKGDRIVCMVGFETYSTDKVKKLQYTLSYGSGLKLVNANTPSATKNGNTYTFTLNNPTSVGETGLGEFTFEVIGTTGLTYGIKDISFVTSNNGYYSTNDNTNTLLPYTKYKNAAAVDMVCYTEESIKANNYVRATNVKKGDRIVCMVGFETYSTDKVKKLQYTLSYGSGLKLVNANTPSATKNGNTYTFTLNNPTSVGETGLGEFTFEVIGTTGLTYGIKDISFVTSNNGYYSTNDNTNTLLPYTKYKNASAVDMVCYTEESIKANNYVRATNVKKGDRIVCMVGFETYSTDKVKKLQYTLSYGSGLKLVNANTPSATKNGNTYTFTLKNPTSVGETGLGEFTFEVIGTTGLTYGIKDISFVTSNNGYYSTNDNTNTLTAK